MKSLLLALTVFLPLGAQAATDISCGSSPVDFKITSEDSILKPGTKLVIEAQGNFTTTFSAVVNVVESVMAPLAVVNITTLNEKGEENLASSIHARLEIPIVVNGSNFEVQGAGKIQLTKIPALHPRRMLSRYVLSSCKGTI